MTKPDLKESGSARRRVLAVIMDGVGYREATWGNAVSAAYTPNMDWLRENALFTTLRAHGTAVGMPSDQDMGNSEVGHNVIGSGQVFDQGAKLVDRSIQSGELFRSESWKAAIASAKAGRGVIHFIGLLSDGNVHSHIRHLFAMLSEAQRSGISEAFIHPLFDGRDVENGSAERFAAELETFAAELSQTAAKAGPAFRARIADGGGRMHVTMDRYEADWEMVRRGYDLYTRGEAKHRFASVTEAFANLRAAGSADDQYLPTFCIVDAGHPIGLVRDGDSVILFNFRGDRAIEISQAFDDAAFSKFPRPVFPRIFFAAMIQYDGDLSIPKHYLVAPPQISHTLGELLVSRGLRQFACSETQKFGHVTFFWNGNRSGYIDPSLEEYLEIPSFHGAFQERPWMSAAEITDATIARMEAGSFDFGRINFANGDMVGHTGDFQAAVLSVAAVDLMLARLMAAARRSDTILVITADHGNADEMLFQDPAKLDAKSKKEEGKKQEGKTSHTLNPVPLYIYDPKQRFQLSAAASGQTETPPGLANLAGSICTLLGIDPDPHFHRSLVYHR